ncbi:MAG: hypothetical protein NVSMB1_22050 [Polyangiales bacterium]
MIDRSAVRVANSYCGKCVRVYLAKGGNVEGYRRTSFLRVRAPCHSLLGDFLDEFAAAQRTAKDTMA